MAKQPLVFETTFDTYTSSKILGQGGSGYVHSVTNRSGDVFALKYLNPERITTDKLKRFQNEIEFCQRNNHPNIVRLIDTGFAVIQSVKCPFYVMKLYSGTLRSLMGKVPPEGVLRRFAQILDGVEAAHLANVWHRDLKPENVLWSDRESELVVADFGIAHFEEEEIYTAVETHIAARMANFQYSAPEQRIRNTKVDRRADIFALGLILNEMFTGEIIQGAGYRKIGELHPQYEYLDGIVEAMVQQNPDKRPRSIDVIKKELIGRKNEYVARQKYDEAKRQVVKAFIPPTFEPISIIDFDYSDGVLRLKFSRNIPPGWSQEFQYPRGGHSAILGYGPESFRIGGDTASIVAREDASFIQDLINHAKMYVAAANRGYEQQVRELAAQNEQRQRDELQKQVAEAELRRNILANVKL